MLLHSPKESVYVIDSASTDGSVNYLRTLLPTWRIIHLARNSGYTGYNQGLRSITASYSYYALLNTDVLVGAGWLEPLIDFMGKTPQAGACQPKLLAYTESNNTPASFDYAGGAGGYLDPLGYPYCRGRIFGHIEQDVAQYDSKNHACDWTSGACCVLRKEAFWAVGGFDERFFMHMEEIDLCWRFHRIGYGVYCCTQAVVRHVGGGALPKEASQKTFLNFRNNLLMLCKNLCYRRLCWLLPVRMLLDIVACAYFCVQGRWKLGQAVVKAYISFFKICASGKKPATKPLTPSNRSRRAIPFPSHPNVYILFAYFVQKKRNYQQLFSKSRTSRS